MKSKQEEMVEVNTKDGKKMVPRHKVCYNPIVKKHIIGGVEKTIVSTHDAAYIKDEGSGCLIRIGKKKTGKVARKREKKARMLERTSKL
jgi:hypothetical protein